MSKDNTVGSLRISMINLTQRQQDILIGTLLGDGCLEVNGSNVRLKIDHSLNQKQLTQWIFEELKEFCKQKPSFLKRYDKRTEKFYYHYRFSTLSKPVFNNFHSMFYSKNRKIIPMKIKKLLNSLSLAVWYMDDGFRRRDCNSLYLCTSAYTQAEHILLLEALKMNFDIDAKVHFAAGNARIYIPASSAKHFCDLVKNFVLKDLSYKLIS